MGRGGGGRGSKGQSGWSRSAQDWWPSGAGQGHYGGWGAQGPVAVPAPLPQRPLAAQWRFYCRVLRRWAPEQEVHDARQHVRLGDHLVVHYDWDFGEQHGIVAAADDGGRPQRGDRKEACWVVHWNGSALQRSPLSQFSKGGKLMQVEYPHWAFQCKVPAASTTKLHVVNEQRLHSRAKEIVAQEATSALTSGWRPSWAQAADLEFCVSMKTGGCPPFEVHSRKAVSTAMLPSIGCSMSTEAAPSRVLNSGEEVVGPGSPSSQASKPSTLLGTSPVEWPGATQPQQHLLPGTNPGEWLGATQPQHHLQQHVAQAAPAFDLAQHAHNHLAAYQNSLYQSGCMQGCHPNMWGGFCDHGQAAYNQDQNWVLHSGDQAAFGLGHGWGYPAMPQNMGEVGQNPYQ